MKIQPKKKKIFVVYLGGAEKPFVNRHQAAQWFEHFSEMEMMANAQMVSLAPRNTDELQFVHLQRAVRRVVREWNKHDGFIVTLPYNEYMYYSNMLSFMFGKTVEKPVVLSTSLQFTPTSNRPSIEDVDLKANILNATIAATTGVAGVAVIGGKYIVPAAHAVHEIEKELDIIRSIDGVTVGHIDFGVHLDKRTHIGDGSKPTVALDLPETVERFHLQDAVDISDEIARLRTLSHSSGVIIDGGKNLQMSITKELPQKVPALLIADDTILLHEKNQLSPVARLSPSAAAGKFSWLLGQKSKGRLQSLLQQDYIGELLQTPGV